MSQKQKHTIVLIQDTDYRNSRTYYDYPTITAAMNGISSIFEHKLTEKTRKRSHKHDINEIYNFIDNLTDISCLILDLKTNEYSPRTRKWIKERILTHFKNFAQKTNQNT